MSGNPNETDFNNNSSQVDVLLGDIMNSADNQSVIANDQFFSQNTTNSSNIHHPSIQPI
jgi:hypothetical protein